MAGGLPDYAQGLIGPGRALIDVTNEDYNPGQSYGPFDLTTYATLVVWLDPLNATGAYILTINWFTDLAATKQVGKTQWRTEQGKTIADQVASLAPFCTITVVSGTAEPNDNADFRVVPYAWLTPRSRPIDDFTLADDGGALVAPATTLTVPAKFVLACKAKFSYWMPGPTATAGARFTVQWIDTFALAHVLYRADWPAGALPTAVVDLYLPGGLVQILFTNGTAVNVSPSMALVAEP